MKVRQPKIKTKEQVSPEQAVNPDIQTEEEKPQPDPLPDYDSRFKRIHNFIVECNPDEEWPIVEDWINRKPNSLQDALGMLAEHPSIKVKARRLALLAQRELKRFTFDWKDRTGILRTLARDYWESRKKGGMSKQITNDMIDDWIIENYGTAYAEMYMRLQDMENVASLLGKLADNVDQRDADLRRMVDKLAPKDSTSPGWFGDGMKYQKGRK